MDHTQITMAFVHVSLSSNCCCAAAAALAVSYHGRKKTLWPYIAVRHKKNHPKKKHISSNTCKPWSVKALRLHQDRPLVWSSHVFVFLSDDEDVKRKAGNEHPASVETFATPPLSRRGPLWTIPGPGGTLSCILRIACDKVEWSCIELKPCLFLYVYVSFAGLFTKHPSTIFHQLTWISGKSPGARPPNSAKIFWKISWPIKPS